MSIAYGLLQVLEEMLRRSLASRTPGKVIVRVNGKFAKLTSGNLLASLREAGHNIPSTCWHADIPTSGGRCRACVCRVNERLVTPCNMAVAEGQNIETDTPELVEMRHTALSFSRFREEPLGRKTYIQRNPAMCAHCHLCVDVCENTQGVGAVEDTRLADSHGHGTLQTFLGMPFMLGECISCGQCINVCPTSALQEVSEIEQVQEALTDNSKIVVVHFAPAVRVTLAEEFGFAPGERVLTHEMVAAVRKMGKFTYVFDTDFTADLTIIEEGHELLERLRRVLTGTRKFSPDKEINTDLPMITSCCPAWVMHCEKRFHDLLPNLSSCKSPMGMSGALTELYWAPKMGIRPEEVFTVAVMPCVAKKMEKDRPELYQGRNPNIDAVLTTREFAQLCRDNSIDPSKLVGENFDNPYGIATGAGQIFGATGGVMEAALRTVYEVVTGRPVPFRHLNIQPVRGLESVKEASIQFENVLPDWKFLEGVEVKVAVVHGTGNAGQLMERVLAAKKANEPPPYHFVEVMACHGGCIGGGGQPKPISTEIKKKRIESIYKIDSELPIRKSHENPAIMALYDEYLEKPLSHNSHRLLHTTYQPRLSLGDQFLDTPEAMELKKNVLERYPEKVRTGVTNILTEIVDKYGAISDIAVSAVAKHIGVTPVMLDAIISHYHYLPRIGSDHGYRSLFHVRKAPKTYVLLCNCIHCRIRGADSVKKALVEATKGDNRILVSHASWLGWCVGGGPAALVSHNDGSSVIHQLLNLTPDDPRLSPAALKELDDPVGAPAYRILSWHRKGDTSAPTLFKDFEVRPKDGMVCPASEKIFGLTPDQRVDEIMKSGLRGCGGAGFPTYLKWKAVRSQPEGNGKCVVVNADEGLPNTFKDYSLMYDPGCRMRLIIGMCAAADTVGANECYVYLRYEYRNLKPLLEESFQKYTSTLNPAFGAKNVKFFVILGAGPYVCGEETALFESLEGRLPQARASRAKFPTEQGLFGRPTLISNVETFSWVTQILYHGGEAFARLGASGKHFGLKLLCLSGDVKEPAVVEVAMGTTLRAVLEECAGIPIDDIAAVEVGGITEPLTYPHDFDLPLSLQAREGHISTGGSIVVFKKENFIAEEVYQHKAQFSELESCQLCGLCRDGTKMLRRSMQSILTGTLNPLQEANVLETLRGMEVSSLCGHEISTDHSVCDNSDAVR